MTGEQFDEEFVPEEEAQNPGGVIKKLRERLHAAEKEKQEYLEGWQRSRADFSNLKREEETRRAHTGERLKASFAEESIPALDSFEMAFRSPSFQKADQEWQKGLRGLYQQFVGALRNFGVEQWAPAKGEQFDPKKHEILKETPTESENDHTIEEVLRSGYSVGEHIIRPAQVSVWIRKN